MRRASVEKIRIHDLRHTAASIAISSGATPNMVKEMLGHSDVQLTMRVYAHIFEADRAKVAENLNRAVYEVHKRCTEVGVESEIPVENLADTPSDQRKYKSQTDYLYLGTSDYESGALTN